MQRFRDANGCKCCVDASVDVASHEKQVMWIVDGLRKLFPMQLVTSQGRKKKKAGRSVKSVNIYDEGQSQDFVGLAETMIMTL